MKNKLHQNIYDHLRSNERTQQAAELESKLTEINNLTADMTLLQENEKQLKRECKKNWFREFILSIHIFQ